MKFKVGDKVKIKSWEEMEKEFGLDCAGNINCNSCFTGSMKKYCGATATISGIDSDEIVELTSTSSDLDFSFWTFSTDMIKKAIDFKTGDRVRINKQAAIEDFTKNYWNGCKMDTLNFIRSNANKEETFIVTKVAEKYLKLKGYDEVININIFELVERKDKKVTMKEVCEKFGYDVEIVKEEE